MDLELLYIPTGCPGSTMTNDEAGGRRQQTMGVVGGFESYLSVRSDSRLLARVVAQSLLVVV